MSIAEKKRLGATIDDLCKIDGKAELVNGEIILMPPTGGKLGLAGDEIYSSLRSHTKETRQGLAVSDGKGFRVDLPNRQSFSPDAALYSGLNPGMRFFEGAPIFAVEVRSENDYGPRAEEMMAQKRRDYFAAGTLVVWDVDLLSDDVVRKYVAGVPADAPPFVFRRGAIADAEPAAPGWRMAVNDLFDNRAEF